VPTVHNTEFYTSKVVEEFLAEIDGTFECRKRLWRTIVTLWELTGDASPYIDQLVAAVTNAGMRYRDVMTTVASAERRYRGNIDPRYQVA
jgi:hypothetical protein